MKPQKILFLTFILLTLTFSAFSQRRTGGKVIEVIDGKTAVVRLPSGLNLTVVLQYIEIPEPEQQLRQTVKEHLQKLILNQTVEVNARGINESKTIAQILLRGVDISQQMIRDGAAWYAYSEKGGQNDIEVSTYQSQEAIAKSEKRGIWAIEGMMPAWEVRAAREEKKKLAERDALEKIKIEAREAAAKNEAAARSKSGITRRKPATTEEVLWANPNSSDIMEIPDAKGLIRGSIPGVNFPYVMTGTDIYYLSNNNDGARVESRVIYMNNSGKEDFLTLAFLSKSDKEVFKNSSSLTLTADDQKFNITKMKREVRKLSKSAEEMLMFKIDRSILMAIAQAQHVTVTIGDFKTVSMPVKSHEAIKHLILELSKKENS